MNRIKRIKGINGVAALIAIVLAGVSLSAPPVAAQATPAKKVVHIVAERFAFAPSHITVEPGTVVEIRLTSEDTAHGFRMAGPNGVDVTIPKRGRGEIVVPFEATQPGDYVFECSRMCGAGHSFMRGRIRVKARP
jgi:heme/copper-type cytochrome/quinol oxidase subunit 2